MQWKKVDFRFGVLSSADVKLWLMNQSGENYERNPLHLHSAILERSEFFKVKMSERWSSDKRNEIRVTTTHNFDNYLKCIQPMYGERVYFTSVEECLVILSVASELLADGCIKKCMEYLEAVRWSAEEINGAILIVIESLPLVDKKHFSTKWLKVYDGSNIGITTPLTLFKDLHVTHCKSLSKQ